VAETVVELPMVMGEVAAVVREVMLALLTTRLAHVPVATLLFPSPP
jgi:hypothetical protein